MSTAWISPDIPVAISLRPLDRTAQHSIPVGCPRHLTLVSSPLFTLCLTRESQRDQVDQSLGSERLIATLTNIFAAIALLLSAIGIFGLLAQERTSEFGVRIAVGATRGNLLTIVLADALRMVAIGSICGLALASIGYIFVRRFLYGVSPADIRVAVLSLVALAAVALLAAAIPAHRAASLDPTQALRAE
jgi:putative ABC transport system permease protein